MGKVAVLALAVGCYHGSAPAPAPPPRAVVASEARTAADPLGFLPSEASFVAHLDVAQLRRSALWVRLEPSITPRIGPAFEPFRVACGFDPLHEIATITVGIRTPSTPEVLGVAVIRGIERRQLVPCVEKVAASTPDVATIDRDVVLLRPDPGEKPIAFAFADARTLVVVAGERARTAPPVREILRGGAPLRRSDVFMDLHARLEHARAAWFVLADAPQLFGGVRAMGYDVRAIYGSLDVAVGATAKLFARMGDAAGAANLVATLQAQITAAQALVDRLELSTDDDVVTVDLALTEDQAMLVSGFLLP